MEFYICNHCGNIITFLSNKGAGVNCCGERMTKIIPNSIDASNEKHIPIIKLSDNLVTVCVGSIEHPMSNDHFIEWILLETNNGYQMCHLSASDAPKATFKICDNDKIVATYAFCNLHGLWVNSLS